MQALSEDWAQGESGQSASDVIRLRAIAVGASLCLHALLVFAVIRNGGIEFQPPATPLVAIALVPNNPLIEARPEEIPADESEAITEDLAAEQQQEIPDSETALPEEAVVDPVEPLTALEEEFSEIPEIAEAVEPTAPLEADPPEDAVAPVTAPSVLAIQNSVRRDLEQQANDSRDWANSCSELQRLAGTLGCQQTEEPDYQAAVISPQRQSVYEYHNPVVERSRSETSLQTIATRTGELAGSLALSEIPAGLSDYLLAEVEASISVYSNQGDPVLQQLNRMADRSAAAEMVREINSPWVQLQTQLNQARRYRNRQDLQESEECQSALLLIFTPAEIAECLGDGHYGVLLSPLNFTFDIDY